MELSTCLGGGNDSNEGGSRKRRASSGEGAEESETSMAHEHGYVHSTAWARSDQGPDDGTVKRQRVQTEMHAGVTHDTGRDDVGTVHEDGVT